MSQLKPTDKVTVELTWQQLADIQWVVGHTDPEDYEDIGSTEYEWVVLEATLEELVAPWHQGQ